MLNTLNFWNILYILLTWYKKTWKVGTLWIMSINVAQLPRSWSANHLYTLSRIPMASSPKSTDLLNTGWRWGRVTWSLNLFVISAQFGKEQGDSGERLLLPLCWLSLGRAGPLALGGPPPPPKKIHKYIGLLFKHINYFLKKKTTAYLSSFVWKVLQKFLIV